MQNGETALHKASLKGHIDIVQLLVKYGAAVDIRDKVSNNTQQMQLICLHY